jgi:hypothetical protein
MRQIAQLLRQSHGRSGGTASRAQADRTPEQIVAWLGGVQAQNYAGAKWSVGLRIPGVTETEIEQAIATGRVVRTWAFRGTLHLLAAEDVAWMLSVLAGVVIAANQRRYRELELDEATFVQSNRLLRSALADGDTRSRSQLSAALEKGGISTAGQRAPYLLQRAALEGLICLGPNRSRESTYIAVPETVDSPAQKNQEEGLPALAERYFASHGPATLQDFSWWSGLPASRVRRAVESANSLQRLPVGDSKMWAWAGADQQALSFQDSPPAQLLPPFDEYLLGYRDRSAVLDPAFTKRVNAGGGMFKPVLVLDGRVAGVWKRRMKARSIEISFEPFRRLSEEQRREVERAAQRYGRFIGTAVELA